MLRNPFCILEGTEKECSYLGSVKTMKVARVEEVETLPERSDDGSPVSQAPIAFFPESFVEYQFSDDSVRFSETGKLTSSGLIYNQKVEGFHPGTDSEALYEVARLADGHYIVIVELFAGPIRLLGTKETPFIFSSNFDTGKKRTDIAGSLFEFNGQSDFPSITLTESTVAQSSPCALLTPSAWLYQAWDINVGANYRLDKIYVDPAPNGLIISVTSRPDGILYNHYGAAIDTLVWNAGGWYEPANGPHTIIGNWQAEIYGLLVNTGSPVTSCSYFFIQSYSLQNSPPEFTAINYFGTPVVGNTLTIIAAYNDVDGDAYDPVNSVYQFYQSDDDIGTNEVLIHTGQSYTILPAQGGKYIQMRATPHALTGASPGAAIKTARIEIPLSVPEAQNVNITGTPETGETLNGNYIYFDNDGDLEGLSVKEWYSYTDAAGTIGETLVGTGDTYDPVVGDATKYLRFKVTPVALTGQSPGAKVASDPFGPIIHYETFTFQTNINANPGNTFDPKVEYSGPGLVKWCFEDSSELIGNEISSEGNGLDGTVQDVILKLQDFSQVTAIKMAYDHIYGTFDISQFTGITELRINNNNIDTLIGFNAGQDLSICFISNNPITNAIDFSPASFSACTFQAENINIAAFTPPGPGSEFYYMYWAGCSSLTAADLSDCSFIGTTNANHKIDFNNCTALTALALGSGTINNVQINSTAIESIDYSTISVVAQIQQRSCSALISATYGSQTNTLTQILSDYCTSLTADQDFSGFTSLPGYLFFNNTPTTNIILPVAGNAMTTGIIARYSAIDTITNLSSCSAISNATTFNLDLRNSGLSTGQVNVVLDDLLSVSSSGYGSSRTVKIEGNTAPDSGPPDGDQAAIDLAALGFVVTTD